VCPLEKEKIKDAKFIYNALGGEILFVCWTAYLQVADLIVFKSVLLP
jgi:hypothetical protein